MEAVEQGRSAELASTFEATGTLTAVDAMTLDLIREGGSRTGELIVGLVSFFTPSLGAIGGGVSGLGYTLLPAMRPQVHRRSLSLTARATCPAAPGVGADRRSHPRAPPHR